MAGDIEGLDKLVKNLSSYEENVVRAIAVGAQKSQVDVINHAIANHGPDAHSVGRFRQEQGVTTGNLIKSIQPGGVTIQDDSVEALIEARAEYAGYVEGHPLFKETNRGVYPFLKPALEDNKERFTERILTEVKKAKP